MQALMELPNGMLLKMDLVASQLVSVLFFVPRSRTVVKEIATESAYGVRTLELRTLLFTFTAVQIPSPLIPLERDAVRDEGPQALQDLLRLSKQPVRRPAL